MTNRRILIVDDDPGLRQLVAISLSAIAGWDTVSAGSGPEGLQLAETERPDAILLDVMMPDMHGLDVLSKLRSTAPIRDIPVILLTAKSQYHERQQLIDLPISGIITKPFKAPNLVAEVKAYLNWEW